MDRYQAILDYLYNRLPMFQRTGPAAYKHSLGNTLLLDEMYGHPHRNYPTLHVAGTNGKGSVSHMLAAVLQSAGYRTGLYTSPHLVDFRERIRISGKMIPRAEIIRMVDDFHRRNQGKEVAPSFFELTAALAFDYFSRKKVDIAVVEVGLGGRLDSTNIITPEVSIITNISYDHVPLLGHTLQEIAAEKAGIIKPGVPVVISQWQEEVAGIFETKAAERSAPLFRADKRYSAAYGMLDLSGHQIFNFYPSGITHEPSQENENRSDRELPTAQIRTPHAFETPAKGGKRRAGESGYPGLKTDLAGIYQRYNIPAVLTTIDLLREKGWNIPREAVYRGVADVAGLTGLQGRWQVIGRNPLVVCDTGHNEDGIRQVTEQIKQTAFKKLHFILGVVADKDASAILALLPRDAVYYFTRANIPRALDASKLKEEASRFGLRGEVWPTVEEAFRAALAAAGPHDMVFAGGSNFVVAEVLPLTGK